MRSLGLLVRLLSRPDNWKTNSDTLAREFRCGREQMRSVINELVDAGYMVLQKVQDDKGLWTSQWSVYDSPISMAEKPTPGKPYVGEPNVGALGPITRTDLPSTDTKMVKSKTNTVDQEDAFNIFWKNYPRKTNKGFARKVFYKLNPDEPLVRRMLNAIELQSRSEQWKNSQYIPHPSTWLNGERWEDEVTSIKQTSIAGAF